MPWQQHVADVALEVDPATGRLCYRRVILTVPRQSGKTTLMLALFIHRALGMGEPQTMAFAAQNGLDARMRLQREWHKKILQKSPALRDTYAGSWPPGAEALLFHNGSRLQVVAGTEKSGHGQTLDLAMVDEAFAQRDGRLEQALSPAMITRPEPQLWFVSTAGSPSDMWFRDKVERGRSEVDSDQGVAFFEWSAPQEADPDDRDVWRACMPALGYVRPDGTGITEDAIEADRRGMTADEFRRAYLNQWVDRGVEEAIPAAQWQSLADPAAERGPEPVFAVATAPDRSWAAVAVAWRRPDGARQVMLADYRPTTTWVTQRVAELRARWLAPVLVDTASHGLVDGAEEPSETEQAEAHNALSDAVLAGTVRHGNEQALNISVRSARWAPRGNTRVLDRKGSTDISPLVAAALAVHGLGANRPSVYEERELLVL
jgi:phage terminase large subunit-like protein